MQNTDQIAPNAVVCVMNENELRPIGSDFQMQKSQIVELLKLGKWMYIRFWNEIRYVFYHLTPLLDRSSFWSLA